MDKKLSKPQVDEAKKLDQQIGIVLKSMPKDWTPNKGTGAVPAGTLINLRIPIDHIAKGIITDWTPAKNAVSEVGSLFKQQWQNTVKPNLQKWAGSNSGSAEGILTTQIIGQMDFIKEGVDDLIKVLAK